MLEFCWDGVRIQLHILFLGMLTLFLLVDPTGISAMGLGASLLHELGHLAACRLTGARPRALSFELSGIRLTGGARPLPFGKELAILLAGSGVNLLLAAVLYWISGKGRTLAAVHLCLGFLNLLPMGALDGGKILRLVLERRFSLRTAQAACTAVQAVLAGAALLAAVTGLWTGGFHITALIFCLYLLAGWAGSG